jgi:hypothetical protein
MGGYADGIIDGVGVDGVLKHAVTKVLSSILFLQHLRRRADVDRFEQTQMPLLL